jgi:hypothetical protein
MSEPSTISPMRREPFEWDRIARTRVVRLNAGVLGIVFGLLAGMLLFVMTNVLVLKGGAVVGPHLALLAQVFIGYRVTFLGSLIGCAYGAVFGWGIGYVGATLYNFVAHHRA